MGGRCGAGRAAADGLAWQANSNAAHEVALKFGTGEVALGFGRSVRARKSSLLVGPMHIGDIMLYSNGTLTPTCVAGGGRESKASWTKRSAGCPRRPCE